MGNINKGKLFLHDATGGHFTFKATLNQFESCAVIRIHGGRSRSLSRGSRHAIDEFCITSSWCPFFCRPSFWHLLSFQLFCLP